MKNESGLPPQAIADLRVKYLEMLQGAIDRMATYSATSKNYCITIVMAIGGYAVSAQASVLALLALLPAIVFALLDTQYLRTERRFRKLYDRVRQEDWKAIPTFDMSPKAVANSSFWGTLGSWSILIFYLPVFVCVVLLVIISEIARG